MRATIRVAGFLAIAGLCAALPSAKGQAFQVTNIISDGSVPAPLTDANFLNPWAMSSSGNWWISTANTGFNYVVPATTGAIAFKVIVPQGAQAALNGFPSGSVTTAGSTGFVLPNGTAPSFLFSTLDGTISGWNSKLGTANALSQVVINNSTKGGAYTGLALLNVAGSSYLLAPNFGTAAIDVYNTSFLPAKLAGTFTDPNLPANYAPFAIHILGAQVFVTYAQRTAAAPYREVTGAGLGILDVFDTSGNLTSRAITGGNLNAPWGVAIAPVNFGVYSNDLLVGNFGDGVINVYDPKTFSYIGQLMDVGGNALSYASLWELLPGGTAIANSTSVSGGDVSTVYFTAALAGEAHGLLAGIKNSVIASSTPTFGMSMSTGALSAKAGSPVTAIVSVAPVNGFSGTVTLSCSGLPIGAACSFSPASIAVSATAVTLGSVSITTTAVASAAHQTRGGTNLASLAWMLLPLASLASFRRRLRGKLSVAIQVCGVCLMLAVASATVGCGNYSPVAATPTPAGQSTVVVSATSGTLTQKTSVTLTIN